LVTDLLNHCIRKIKDGVVSTFAGNAQVAGTDDGTAAQARFTNPMAIAVDNAGIAYVADYLVGIRRIDAAGNVTTIPLKGIGPKGLVGISAYGAGSALSLFVTFDGGGGFELIRPVDNYAERWPTAEPEVNLDNARGIVALNEGEALITDVEAGVIRLGYTGERPFWGDALAHILIGRAPGGSGMADGPASLAQFDRPIGIAVHQHQAVVADAGNRRIRTFNLPDVRRPLTVARLDELMDKSHYRIVLLGASQIFYGSTPETSTGGRLQTQLNKDRTRIGLPRAARVWTARIDGLLPRTAIPWLQNFMNEGQADLVVFAAQSDFLLADRSMKADGPRMRMAAEIREIANLMRSRHIEFFGLAYPAFYWSSPAESIVYRERGNDPGMGGRAYENNLTAGVEAERGLVVAFKAANVPFAAPFDDLMRIEASAQRVPMAFADDPHPNDLGDAFVARQLTLALERAKPWSKSP
jgi:alkylated DNA nucleotide flippase Atl1